MITTLRLNPAISRAAGKDAHQGLEPLLAGALIDRVIERLPVGAADPFSPTPTANS